MNWCLLSVRQMLVFLVQMNVEGTWNQLFGAWCRITGMNQHFLATMPAGCRLEQSLRRDCFLACFLNDEKSLRYIAELQSVSHDFFKMTEKV